MSVQVITIAAIVENRPGVLYRISNMFRRRGFNIDGITVGPTTKRDLARMTITTTGDERVIEQVVKQLSKLADVIRVKVLMPENTVAREMALVKIHISSAAVRSDVIHYVNIFRGRIIDVSLGAITVEVTGDPKKIDAFIDLMKTFGVKEVARTGITALSRGEKSFMG
ncbi:MAG: acetolactate synthase small subunit [Candidatus Bathyarchaeia archaeon]